MFIFAFRRIDALYRASFVSETRCSINDDFIGYASHPSSRHRFFSAIVSVRASKSLGSARGAYPSARAETRPIFRDGREASRRNCSARIVETFSDALSGRTAAKREGRARGKSIGRRRKEKRLAYFECPCISGTLARWSISLNMRAAESGAARSFLFSFPPSSDPPQSTFLLYPPSFDLFSFLLSFARSRSRSRVSGVPASLGTALAISFPLGVASLSLSLSFPPSLGASPSPSSPDLGVPEFSRSLSSVARVSSSFGLSFFLYRRLS